LYILEKKRRRKKEKGTRTGKKRNWTSITKQNCTRQRETSTQFYDTVIINRRNWHGI